MLFSIIVPAYNAESTLFETAQSVISQQFEDWELIVIDDASTDSTWALMQEIGELDSRIRCYQNERNMDVSNTRNRGISLAKGDWVVFLDADDYFAPKRLSAFARCIDEKECDIIADNIRLLTPDDPEGRQTMYPAYDPLFQQEISASYFIRRNMPGTSKWGLGYAKPAIRREFLVSREITYRADVSKYEDFLFLAECLIEGARFIMLPESNYYYRVHWKESKTSVETSSAIIQSRIDSNMFLQQLALSNGDKELRRALELRLVRLSTLAATNSVKDSIRKRKYLEAAWGALSNPRVFILALRWMYAQAR